MQSSEGTGESCKHVQPVEQRGGSDWGLDLDTLLLKVVRSTRLMSLRSLGAAGASNLLNWNTSLDAYWRMRWHSFGQGGPVLRQLTKLNLAENNLRDEDMCMMRKLLGELTQLQHLDLSWNYPLRPARLMVDVLPRLGALTCLDITGAECSLEDAAGRIPSVGSPVTQSYETFLGLVFWILPLKMRS